MKLGEDTGLSVQSVRGLVYVLLMTADSQVGVWLRRIQACAAFFALPLSLSLRSAAFIHPKNQRVYHGIVIGLPFFK